MPISFCPSGILWGDVATWLAAVGTFSAVVVALTTSGAARRHAETLRAADREREAQERDVSAATLAVVVHHAIYMLGAHVEGTSVQMKRLLEKGNGLGALKAYSTHLPRSPLSLVRQYSDKLFLFDAATATAVLQVLADWNYLEEAPDPAILQSAEEDFRKLKAISLCRTMDTTTRHCVNAMKLIHPYVVRVIPDAAAIWPRNFKPGLPKANH